jgi:REP element-mobilizing transposase RayT
MTLDLDRFHSLRLETQSGPSLSGESPALVITDVLRELCSRYPGVRVPSWRAADDHLFLLLDMGRTDEDILRLVLHIKRTLRSRLGEDLQWKWSYRETLGADPEQRSEILSDWECLRG